MGLICDYPCRLDLWAKVIKAKFISRQEEVFNEILCITEQDVGGKIATIDDIKVQLVSAEESFVGNSHVKIALVFNVILIVILESGAYELVNLEGLTYNKSIPIDEFDPPLSPQEFREEVDQSEIILKNWSFDYEILGYCEDPGSPCVLPTPVAGTCISLKVYVDIIDKLGKFHDVIVFGELDPEVDP